MKQLTGQVPRTGRFLTVECASLLAHWPLAIQLFERKLNRLAHGFSLALEPIALKLPASFIIVNASVSTSLGHRTAISVLWKPAEFENRPRRIISFYFAASFSRGTKISTALIRGSVREA
jgi:hypothetical protein